MSVEAFEHHRAQVYGWAFRLLQNHHDALDVTQDVFIKWWRLLAKGDSPANPPAWLRQVTVNQAIDALRKSAVRKEPIALEKSAVAEPTDLAHRESLCRLADALHHLTQRQRSVLTAKIFDGCTFANIAETMELSIPTVKSHYFRALQTLRAKLPDLRRES